MGCVCVYIYKLYTYVRTCMQIIYVPPPPYGYSLLYILAMVRKIPMKHCFRWHLLILTNFTWNAGRMPCWIGCWRSQAYQVHSSRAALHADCSGVRDLRASRPAGTWGAGALAPRLGQAGKRAALGLGQPRKQTGLGVGEVSESQLPAWLWQGAYFALKHHLLVFSKQHIEGFQSCEHFHLV